jgi:SHS2 domain-containing protein
MTGSKWKPFEEAEHTADLALVARGRDFRELIENAALGVIYLIAETGQLQPEEWVPINSTGTDPARVLVGFIRELLVEWELRGGLPVAAEVAKAPDASWLEAPGELAEVCGRMGIAYPSDLDDRIKGVPKAATYHGLEIRRVGELLETDLVLDT